MAVQETRVMSIPQRKSLSQNEIIEAVKNSECFRAESAYARRGGYEVAENPRLFKFLEEGLVRVVFPTNVSSLEDGTVIAITCLYDLNEQVNIYGHTIIAGPGVNGLLKAIHAPLGQANCRPGREGEKAVLHFVEWKKASWGKFLNDELEYGNEKASGLWIANFWKALDRMFGGGYLLNYNPDEVLKSLR